MRDVVVRRCSQGASLVVPVKISGTETVAVIDSAAQVTVVSEDLCEHFKQQLPYCEPVKLRGAAKEGFMLARFLKGVEISIGGEVYKWDVYVAPITDDLILGLDFVLGYQCSVDFRSRVLTIGSKVIPAVLKEGDGGPQISRIVVKKRTVVPPNSMVRFMGKMEVPLKGDCVISPVR